MRFNITMIISAFPGLRKDALKDTNKDLYVYLNPKDYKKTHFIEDYTKDIKNHLYQKMVILVNSKPSIRESLLSLKLPFIYVIPTLDRKEEFLYQYKMREFPDSFIEKANINWERWLLISAYNNAYPTIALPHGYLSDNMEFIVKSYTSFYRASFSTPKE